jgi:peptidoglycan/xylan/chitin deacetylase (PgdA/CDA1 family)
VAGAALLSACNSERISAPPTSNDLPAREVRKIAPPAVSTVRPTSPLMSFSACGAPVTYQLSDLHYTPGTVTVANDATNLYVTYATPTQHWWISDTRLFVGKNAADIPRDEVGDPEPWSFPYFGEHEPPITSVTYTLALSKLGLQAGQTAVVSAMAGVVHPVDVNNYDGDWEWLVMWGIGGTSGGKAQTINNYTIASCDGSPPPPPPPPPPSSGGIFTITFDDGWKTTYTNAYPALKELGLKGNVAVNPDPIDGGWSGYMTLADLQVLSADGWSIVSHTLSHRDLTTLSASELDRELRDSQAWVQRNGFGPTDVFIVPFHSWGTRERDAIKKYYTRVRGYTIDQFEPPYYSSYPITRPLDLTAFEPEYAPFTTDAGRAKTLAVIDHAINNGQYVDIFFHKITNTQLPAFKTLMQQVATRKASLRTWAEFSAAPTP